jgi:hypothetical protein
MARKINIDDIFDILTEITDIYESKTDFPLCRNIDNKLVIDFLLKENRNKINEDFKSSAASVARKINLILNIECTYTANFAPFFLKIEYPIRFKLVLSDCNY